MSGRPPKIPEGFVQTEDGCICPERVVREEKECAPSTKVNTCPPDPRFPHANQTKHCYVSFIDYQRCARLLGDYPGCNLFYRCYSSLCPSEWVEKWFTQMENGTFPGRIYPKKPVVRPKIPKPVCAGEEEPDEFEEEEEKEVC